MSWALYRWTWELRAPLYLGLPPAGSLNRTRLVVPARTLWGALTAEVARHEAGEGAADYGRVGDMLRRDGRFGCLFPAERLAGTWQGWLPVYRGGKGLVWEREDNANSWIPDRRFRRRLLDVRPGTSIDPANDAVVQGSLRETECIQTRWRDGDGHSAGQVGMVGYVMVRRDSNLADRIRAIEILFIGGDTRYGLGRLERVAMEPATTLFSALVELEGDEPLVVMDRLVGHSLSDANMAMVGRQEAVGGWNTVAPMTSEIVWVPGSRCEDGMARPWVFSSSGMLRMAKCLP